MTDKYLLVSVDSGDEFILLNGTSYVVGRNPDCDLVITDGYPSRQHARIVVRDEQVIVEDLGSTNGTFVNKRQIDNPVQIKPGDVVKFDSAAFHLVVPESGSSTLVMRNLGSTNQMPAASSIVIDGDGEENVGNETAFHQAFPLPPDWKDNEVTGSTMSGGGFSREQIDQLLDECIPKDGGVSAALVITSGNHKARVVGLIAKGDKQRWTIGRDEKCQFPLTDASISSQHAILQHVGNAWDIKDTNSTNGLKINGRKELQGRLRDGDKISLGQVNMVFRLL